MNSGKNDLNYIQIKYNRLANMNNPNNEKVRLQNCLSNLIQSGKNDFFDKWFKEYGKSVVFIFQKNLKVTNIQFAELISLIKLNTFQNMVKLEPKNVSIATTFDFNGIIREILDIYHTNKKGMLDENELISIVYNNYFELIRDLIVVDFYQGSAIVHLPYGLAIDLRNITFLSGYIKFSGENIYIRRITKANRSDFAFSLRRFITKHKETIKANNEINFDFLLYAHEDFTLYDRKRPGLSFTYGLDDVKIYVEKFYIDSEPLLNTIYYLRDIFIGDIHFMEGGNYLNNSPLSANCIWLIIDRDIHSNDQNPDSNIYYICYYQLYKNESQFHIFDEDKPGWIDHTTLPHSLMASLINISNTFINNHSDRPIRVLDPFIGSGTIILEYLKYNNISIVGNDLNVLAKKAIEDNIKFFFEIGLEGAVDLICFLYDFEEGLVKLVNSEITSTKRYTSDGSLLKPELIKKCEKFFNKSPNNIKKEFKIFTKIEYKNHFTDLLELIYKSINLASKSNIKSDEILPIDNYLIRILIYIALKANIRDKQAITRNTSSINISFLEELKKFIFELNGYIGKILKSISKNEETKNFIQFKSKYSSSLMLNHNINYSKNKFNFRIENIDAIEFMKKEKFNQNKYDVLITDPPYGFNTNEDLKVFSELFSKMIPQMIDLLDVNGQLILCLPNESFTGRRIFFFTTAKFITFQVLYHAQRLNRKVVNISSILPNIGKVGVKPYYWTSEKALSRNIVHFIFD